MKAKSIVVAVVPVHAAAVIVAAYTMDASVSNGERWRL